MTDQAMETLLYEGRKYCLDAEPLDLYLRNKKIKFFPESTACTRGYYGTWEIRNNQLFLVELVAYVEGLRPTSGRRGWWSARPEKVGTEFLFPGQREVFASWFSGEIRIPSGKILEFELHRIRHEKDNFLIFENGILKSKRTVYNVKDSADPGQRLDEGLGDPPEGLQDFLTRKMEEKAKGQK